MKKWMRSDRRSFLATCALTGAAAAHPLAGFGQAVDNAMQASAPSALRITDLKSGDRHRANITRCRALRNGRRVFSQSPRRHRKFPGCQEASAANNPSG
jgi:hypothetical protein